MSPVLIPSDMNATFAAAFNTRDLEALSALYEPQAIHVGPHGQQDRGTEAITHGLRQLLALGGTMHSTNRSAIQTGELALLHAHWEIHTHDRAGQPLILSGHSIEIVRQQPTGHWLYVIDHPWGSEPGQK